MSSINPPKSPFVAVYVHVGIPGFTSGRPYGSRFILFQILKYFQQSLIQRTVKAPFLQGLFFTRFLLLRKRKKRYSLISKGRLRKISDNTFLLTMWSFSYKTEKYLLMFVSNYVFYEQNLTYPLFYSRSVNYN